MIAYVTIGADDLDRARRFYSAFLPALGYQLKEGPEGLSYSLPARPDQSVLAPDFYVKSPFDGGPASAGNGSMIAFEAHSQEQVRDLHRAALAAGGSDEGRPGFRDAYGPEFYVAISVTLVSVVPWPPSLCWRDAAWLRSCRRIVLCLDLTIDLSRKRRFGVSK